MTIVIKDIQIIESDYQKAGEILPYYYLYKKKLFEKCMIIHDSTFINKKFDFINIHIDTINHLWHFEHHANDYINETKMIEYLDIDKDEDLIECYDAKQWYGCFGCQSIVHYDFIKKLENIYHIFKLIHYIDTRSKRMNFERIFSLLCTKLDTTLYFKKSIYGNILDYQDWGFTFNDYLNIIENTQLKVEYDLIKTWNGR